MLLGNWVSPTIVQCLHPENHVADWVSSKAALTALWQSVAVFCRAEISDESLYALVALLVPPLPSWLAPLLVCPLINMTGDCWCFWQWLLRCLSWFPCNWGLSSEAPNRFLGHLKVRGLLSSLWSICLQQTCRIASDLLRHEFWVRAAWKTWRSLGSTRPSTSIWHDE